MAKEDYDFISTSKLAKDVGIPIGSVFAQLQEMGLVEKVGDKWELTEAGQKRGGKYLSHPKYGTWIAWPKNVIKVEASPGGEMKPLTEIAKEQHLTATTLGRIFGIPATRMNYVLSELGWIQKSLKGWKVTPQGVTVGGVQREDTRSGIPYIAWPDSIATNASLRNTIDDIQGKSSRTEPGAPEADKPEMKDLGFRERFSTETGFCR